MPESIRSNESRPPAVQGLPLHTRSLTVAVWRSTASTWHARGDVIDLRKNGFVPSSYDLQPSGIIHMMSIDLELDLETLEIDAMKVDQPFVAIEPSEATRGECCRDPAPRLLELTGERLDADFARKLGLQFGGALGCSHLLTLFRLMASTVPRAVELERTREAREGTQHDLAQRFFRRSVFVDGHAHSPELTDVAVQLADTQTRPIASDARMTDRLALSHEVKTFASVDRKRFTLERLEVRERERSSENVGSTQWTDHAALVAPLMGARIIPGMAGRVFKLMGGDPRLRPVLDNLLMFAPGFIQIMAALMDEYFEQREKAEDPTRTQKPAVANLGGNADACYMWRRDGPLSKSWATGDAEPSPRSTS